MQNDSNLIKATLTEETRSKQCTKCGEIKEFTEFRKNKRGLYGVRADCKNCEKEYRKEFYVTNREKVIERVNKYRKNNRDDVNKRQKLRGKRYYNANKNIVSKKNKIYYQNNKEYIKDRNRKYRKENIENNRCSENNKAVRRRSSKRRAVVSWGDTYKIKEFYRDAAFYTRVSGEKYEVDHIDPLQHPLVCGLHVENNLQILLGVKNSAKKNKFTPYRIDQYGVKTLLKIPDKWIRKCQAVYDLEKSLQNR